MHQIPKTMKTVKFDVTYSEKASRWELIIRFLWSIPSYIVVFVLAIIMLVSWVLQFIHVLIMGKRNKTLYDWTLKYLTYLVKYESYLFILTEERNPILPES